MKQPVRESKHVTVMKVSNEKPKINKYGVTTEYVVIGNNSLTLQSYVELYPDVDLSFPDKHLLID